VEDSAFDRLNRNNFVPGTAFEVHRRPGTGLVISQAILGTCHVSTHKRAALLSYEASDLGSFLGTPEVRVRIQVGQIVVTPLVRFHSVARPATAHWSIKGEFLTTAGGVVGIRTATPLNLARTAGTIEAALDRLNLVFVTEIIGNQRPGRVLLTGEPILLTVAGQFLRAGGYSDGAIPGEFVR
jgi:hypothetical protein